MRLTTFSISHFSEKARWALQYEGVDFDERRLSPGFHVLSVRRLAPRTSVPVLEHDGRVIQGSSAILDYVQNTLGRTRLAPRPGEEARAAELERLADRAFGLGVQRVFYDVLLRHRAVCLDLWSLDAPRWVARAYPFVFPLVAGAVKRSYKIRPEVVAEARSRFEAAWAAVGEALSDGRPWLGGDAPSRADVTVAALLGPVVRPPEHHVAWPEVPEGEPARAWVESLEGTPTWSLVRRMYAEHRRPDVHDATAARQGAHGSAGQSGKDR